MAFDSQHRVWTPLFNFNGLRNSVPFPLTPAAPSTALAAVGVQVTWPDAHVYRYRVYRDGALIATLAGQSYNDTAVASGTHDYTISVGLADQITWSPQSPASTISLSAGSLVFSQPPDYTISIGTQFIDLSQFVSGGNAQKWFWKISGTFPKDVDIGLTTGVVGTEFRERGTFPSIIQVVDTKEEALIMDWTARSTGPGVMWAHDFRADVEITKYKVLAGGTTDEKDANNVSLFRRSTDGMAGGGSFEMYMPAGQACNMKWCRPFQAFPGDYGYVAGGLDLPTPWGSDTPTAQWKFHRGGMHGHPDYWNTTTNNTSDGVRWEGHDFYIQFRYKVSASFYNPANPFIGSGGKLAFVDQGGGGNQELTLQTPSPYLSTPRGFRLYTNFASNSNSNLSAYQGQEANPNGSIHQPGGEWANTCRYPNFGGGNCWDFPTEAPGQEGWTTIEIHVVPGHHNPNPNPFSNGPVMGSTANYRDHGIEVWAQRPGETAPRKIWEKFDYVWFYGVQGAPTLYGLNQFVLLPYMGGYINYAPAVDWWRRYTQLVFSHKWIPFPKVEP